MDRKLEIRYCHIDSMEELTPADRELVASARRATTLSLSPYSNFAVGAALRLESGEIEVSANVESEVYPAGICAERNLLFATAVRYPAVRITSLAILSGSTREECYPCGLCRQTILDVERRQGSPIRVIMAGADSATIVDQAELLLPFSFNL